jgi:hypothetical protein
MGISIDLHIYDYARLMDALEEKGATDRDLAARILARCGHHLGEHYVLLNNEYGEFSPYYKVARLFDAAFKGTDFFDVFLNLTRRNGISWVDDEDVAEALGIELGDEE